MASSNSMAEQTPRSANEAVDLPSSRISVLEIARRLNIGRLAVYSMLEKGIIPGLRLGKNLLDSWMSQVSFRLRLGRRWIITRQAYLTWESTCGLPPGPGLQRQPEVDVVN
jgi:excisionase family DNA binding protein